MKVLVVASEPVDAELIDEVTGSEPPDEVRVIAPTLTGSALRYWMNDTDDAVERAQEVADTSVEQLEGAGYPAEADAVTDDQPAVSVDDALRTFEPDRVLVIKHTEDEESYREDELVEEISQHSEAPIDVREVGTQ